MHIHREVYLQQSLMLFPVHMRVKVNSSAVRIKADFLAYHRVGSFPLNFQRCAHRPQLCPLHTFRRIDIPVFFRIENVDIPVVIVHRLVFVHAHQIQPPAVLHYLPVVFFVVDTCEQSLFIQADGIKRCFQAMIIRQAKR